MDTPRLNDFDAMEKYCNEMAKKSGAIESDEEIIARHKREDEELAERHRVAYWERRVEKSGLPRVFENPERKWEAVPGTEEMIRAVIKYETDLEKNILLGVNLIIIGGKVGTGKTRAISRVGYKILRAGYDVLFFDDKYLASLLDHNSWASEDDLDELIEELKIIPALIIDDYGDGRYSAISESRLHQVLAHRWSTDKSTLMTGNWLNLADMKEKIPERIYSRLNEKAIIAVNESSIDMRLEVKL